MRIEVNGEGLEVESGATLDDLVRQLALVPERLALERNREVVRRADWPQTNLDEGDRIEIVHFVGGGRAVTSDELQVTSDK
ncbi:MAG TPA: sulfur carrier protein ThiS [Pyrinomonadaceae bacterium]